jgi:hypothetical protein
MDGKNGKIQGLASMEQSALKLQCGWREILYSEKPHWQPVPCNDWLAARFLYYAGIIDYFVTC